MLFAVHLCETVCWYRRISVIVFKLLCMSLVTYSGFSGLVVSMLASGTQVCGSDFFGRKNPQHAFLRKGSKAVCPVSQICGTKKNPV
jgi:hypothetical protein